MRRTGAGAMRGPGMAVGLGCVLVAAMLAWPPPARAQENRSSGSSPAGMDSTEIEKEVEALRELLRQLGQEKQAEMEDLRRRVVELEEQIRKAGEEKQQKELEAILAEADAATVAEAEREKEAEAQRESFVGRQRTLQAMNPEISFLGDFSYDWSESEIPDRFVLRGVEIGFQAPLDPYTRFKAFLGAHQELPALEHDEEDGEEHGHSHVELGVGEAYMEWVALPAGMRLTVGQFRQQFGTLNRWHIHALPSVDVPFALRNAFGNSGLVGLGVGADWRIPGPGSASHLVTLQITNPENSVAFPHAHYSDPAFLLRYAAFLDLGADDYFEVGLSGLTGPRGEDAGGRSDLASFDFNYVWEPVQRARYRGLELRGEFLGTRMEEDGEEITSLSFYTYLSWRFTRRWSAGFRYDNAELPWPTELYHEQTFTEGLGEQAITPYLTFWQSEFVRLRFQYQYVDRDFVSAVGPETDNRLWLQVTFAAGPHKHDAY
jgi:hypothetical protein